MLDTPRQCLANGCLFRLPSKDPQSRHLLCHRGGGRQTRVVAMSHHGEVLKQTSLSPCQHLQLSCSHPPGHSARRSATPARAATPAARPKTTDLNPSNPPAAPHHLPSPSTPTTPSSPQTGVTVVSTVSLTIYSDGSGVIGGGNNESNNSWSGSCTSTSIVIQNNMSDGSVIYTQGGSPVSITVGSQLLYWLHVPGTCSGNNTK